MTDFVEDLLGEGETVEPEVPRPTVPVPFSPSPAATLARRTIGTPRLRRDRLKRLSQRHKLIIGMHLNGESHKEIAKVVGCSETTVSVVVRDPLAQEVIEFYHEGVEAELKALFPKVVDAVRKGLEDNSIKTKLAAVDRFAKLTGLDAPEGGSRGDTFNILVDARKKFVQEIREVVEKVKVIEGTSEEVEDG